MEGYLSKQDSKKSIIAEKESSNIRDIENLQYVMKKRHKRKQFMRSTLRLCANLLVVLVVLLPLLYALSIALMPSSEVFTTD